MIHSASAAVGECSHEPLTCHSFASHLLEVRYDIRMNQEFLGHKDFATIEFYSRRNARLPPRITQTSPACLVPPRRPVSRLSKGR